jgi:hypothetical protein
MEGTESKPTLEGNNEGMRVTRSNLVHKLSAAAQAQMVVIPHDEEQKSNANDQSS